MARDIAHNKKYFRALVFINNTSALYRPYSKHKFTGHVFISLWPNIDTYVKQMAQYILTLASFIIYTPEVYKKVEFYYEY